MQIEFPSICGVNFPHIAYLDALGKDVGTIVPKKGHAKWMFMFQDIPSSLRSTLNNDLSLKKWINSYNGEKTYAIFSRDDPLPFFLGFFSIIRKLSHY